MNFEEMLFLKESYMESLDYYQETLNKKKKYGWDWIVITASNDNQAASYHTQIKYRKDNNLIPDVRIDIVPDFKNERIGSGGATLNVLKFLSENDPDWFNKKILLIHSGGDSKRIPQYSACGKLFSHVPRSLIDNRPSTLFDEFLVTLSLLPDRLSNGMLVVSGDVLLLFNYLQIDIGIENSIAISMKEKVDIGQNHGVFLTDDYGKLCKFLHKKSKNELINEGAIDKYNMVDIDTGLIWVDSNITKDLYSLITTNNKIDEEKEKKYINSINRLSFYGDILYPLSSKGTLEEYLNTSAEGILDENLLECRKNIWALLHKRSMKVIKTSPSKFIHVGTTYEMLNLNTNATKKYSFLNWENDILTNETFNECSIINSLIKQNVSIGVNSFIEDSILENANIGNNCVVTGAHFNGNLPDNTVLQILPLKINDNKFYIARVYGIKDNPKEDNSYMNTTFDTIFNRYNIEQNQLWKTNEKNLWSANIFEVCKTEEEAIEAYNRLIRIINNNATLDDINIFINSKRLSLGESYLYADMDLIMQRKNNIDINVRASKILNMFDDDISVDECCKYINNKNVNDIMNILLKYRTDKNYKLDILLSYISEKYSVFFPHKSSQYEEEAYEKIKQTINKENREYILEEPKEDVVIEMPLRINFGGGWSDTPPYCIEQGGTVLNAAISLNNSLPIKVEVKRYKKGLYKFTSTDLSDSIEFDNVNDVKKLNKVGDPFILSKAALICLNIIDNQLFTEYGIEIITNANVPAGSGLGTSSILAGTIITALIKFYSIKASKKEIFDLVFMAEQLISTGGGWQDQIGGLLPGIKLIETKKGIEQDYCINTIKFNKNIKELDDRMILIYTGQRRIAKNLLRQIMNKYMQNEIQTLSVLKKIQHLAFAMKFELENGNVNEFSKLITEHFELIRKIDPCVTNVCIDHIISTCNDYIQGYTIAGAGGGGFLFAILKKGVSREDLNEKLSLVYKDNGVKIYDCSFIQ